MAKVYILKVRLESDDVDAIKEITKQLDVDTMSAAVRLLIRQTSKTLKARGAADGGWFAKMWPDGAPPLLGKKQAKSTAGADESAAFAQKWGNDGPSDPATKRAGGPEETSAGSYADRYGNEDGTGR